MKTNKIKTTDIPNERGVGRKFEFDNGKEIYIYKDIDSLMWNIEYNIKYRNQYSRCGIYKHLAVKVANEEINNF